MWGIILFLFSAAAVTLCLIIIPKKKITSWFATVHYTVNTTWMILLYVYKGNRAYRAVHWPFACLLRLVGVKWGSWTELGQWQTHEINHGYGLRIEALAAMPIFFLFISCLAQIHSPLDGFFFVCVRCCCCFFILYSTIWQQFVCFDYSLCFIVIYDGHGDLVAPNRSKLGRWKMF